MIVIDTSVFASIEILRMPVDDYTSSAVVLSELEFGIVSAKSALEHSERRARLVRIREGRMRFLPFTESTAVFHAELMHATHRHAPAKARSRDLMIAATAYELGASLATLNPRDFRYIAHLVPIVVPPART